MSPQCQNCGNRVSQRFADVMSDSSGDVPACPECDDRKMQQGKAYEYRG